MTEYGSTTISDIQPRKTMTALGKVDTSDDDNKMDYKYIISIT